MLACSPDPGSPSALRPSTSTQPDVKCRKLPPLAMPPTRTPSSARKLAAASPDSPAPTTMTSKCRPRLFIFRHSRRHVGVSQPLDTQEIDIKLLIQLNLA